MANDLIMTAVGNLTADPELRYSQGGVAVANFTVASTPRTFDKAANEWKDGEATFLRCSVWRDYAENVATTLTKGMRVIVTGKFKTRSYEDKDGNKRTSMDLEVDEVGPSLRYANAVVQRIQRDNNLTRQQPPQEDAWANANPDQGWTAPAQPTGPADEPWPETAPF